MPSEPVRVAQVGVGNWGRNVLHNFMALPGADVTAICDIESATLERVASHYPPGLRTTQHFDDLLSDNSVDALSLIHI